MLTLFKPSLTKNYTLPKIDSWPEALHLFDEESCWAVEAALASGRPLLLRGEPGIGKSQLARAVAHVQGVPFLYHVVDERSERDDLLYSYDAVSRLAQAQMASVLYSQGGDQWKKDMAEERFMKPGALWWAFNWQSASDQAKQFFQNCPEPVPPPGWKQVGDARSGPSDCGPVLLIDEIDKADPSVPNGLLESLGNRGFHTAQLGRAVELPEGGASPLVMITTNEERELPAAFLRRCLVLHMQFPPKNKTVEEFLLDRARVYCSKSQISDDICLGIVTSLEEDRKQASKLGLSKPGAAEFLDIIKVLLKLCPGDPKKQEIVLSKVQEFALAKHSKEDRI